MAVELDPTWCLPRLVALVLEAVHSAQVLGRSFEAAQKLQMPFRPV